MQWIDTGLIIIYLIGIALFGLVFSRFVKTTSDYYLADRKLPWWAVGLSINGTHIDTADIIAWTGQGFVVGFGMWFVGLGIATGAFFLGWIMMPCYWLARVTTTPEWLSKRLNEPTGVLVLIMQIISRTTNMAAILFAGALLVQALTGWDQNFIIILLGSVAAIYTISGGLRAVVYTDTIQTTLMWAGVILLIPVAWIALGGASGLQAAASKGVNLHFVNPDTKTLPNGWIMFIAQVAVFLGYTGGFQTCVQRALGGHGIHHARGGAFFAGPLWFWLVGLIGTLGVLGHALYPAIDKPDLLYPQMVKDLLPAGLTGLVIIGYLGALMGTADSMSHAMSTLITKDIYEKYLVKNKPDAHYLLVARIMVIVVLVGGIVVTQAVNAFGGIFLMMMRVSGATLPMLGGLLVVAAIYRRITPWGGLIGFLAGHTFYWSAQLSIPFAWWPKDWHWLAINMPELIVVIVVAVLVSHLQKPPSKDKIDGIVNPKLSFGQYGGSPSMAGAAIKYRDQRVRERAKLGAASFAYSASV